MPTREEREPIVGAGEGGDDHGGARRGGRARRSSSGFDARRPAIVSEEIGIRGEGAVTVVVDPIDGSQNAERGIPYFALSVAVADGDDDGRRRLRVRLRLRRGRGVDGGARRRRLPGRPAAHRAAEGPARVPLVRGDAHRSSSPSTPRASSPSPTGSGSWARRRSPSATSPPAAPTPSSPEAVPLGRLRGGQLLVREQGLVDPADRRPAVRRRAARPRGPLADLRGGDARRSCRGHRRSARPACLTGSSNLADVATHEQIFAALANVIDPELRKPVTELDMVRGDRDRRRRRRRHDRADRRRLPAANSLPGAGRARGRRPRGRRARSRSTFDVMTPDERAALTTKLRGGVRPTTRRSSSTPTTRVIAVASGKGGVGKSSLTVNLAAALAALGREVGVLDADIYGHSIPHMLGISQKPVLVDKLMIPPVAHDLKLMSIGFFVDDNTAADVARADAAPRARAVPAGRPLGRARRARRRHAAGHGRRLDLARPDAAARRGGRRDDAAAARAGGREPRRADGAEDRHAARSA